MWKYASAHSSRRVATQPYQRADQRNGALIIVDTPMAGGDRQRKKVYMETQDIYLTVEGRQRHSQRLEYLLTIKRPEIAESIHDAREAGDVTDNAAYEEAKNEQAKIEGEIAWLQWRLASAKELKLKPGGEEITLGSHVHLRNEDDREFRYAIVGPDEASPSDGRISNESPVGRALMGCKVGDSVTVSTPSGVRTYTVLGLE